MGQNWCRLAEIAQNLYRLRWTGSVQVLRTQYFGGYFLGGYCLNIFWTDFSVCFSSPFSEFAMLSTVA